MLLQSKQDAEEFVFWCVTLQCEVLPKGQGMMETRDHNFCCLGTGVACTVQRPRMNLKENRILGASPTEQEAPDWLKEINRDVKCKTGIFLITMNDVLDKSHKEIGTLLLKLYKDELEYWFSVSPGN